MEKRSNQQILKALEIADDLMDFANYEAGLADEADCGTLFAVCRDCAYKIRRQAEAEHEAHKAKKNRDPFASPILVIFAAAVLSIVFASPVNATIILSTDNTETLGGLTFENGDLAHYDPSTDIATLYFNENLFSRDEDIDAVHVLNNGHIILSTTGWATLGGLSWFEDGDLFKYDPIADSATLFFDEDLFSGNEDIDAVHILDNGNIVLTTVGTATLGGLSFGPGDLAEYNPTTSTATLYFDENNFASSANIDSIYLTTLPEPATIALLGLRLPGIGSPQARITNQSFFT